MDRTRVSASQLPELWKAIEHASAQSQRSDVKGKVARPSPRLAPRSPTGRDDPDRSLPSLQAGPAEQMPLLPVAFSLQWQARPVGSLLRGSPDLQRKVLGGEGATRAALSWGGRKGGLGAQRKLAKRM